MIRSCTCCHTSFQIEDRDLAFYESISPTFDGQRKLVPPPTLCPLCRLQRRLSFHNLIFVYPQKSAFSGKKLISMWPTSANIPVYDNDEWWGDGWDPCASGGNIDLTRPFFDQLRELRTVAPHYSRSIRSEENCPYANNLGFCKNSYMIFDCGYCEDCFYSETLIRCKNCFDCTNLFDSELCYDVTQCNNCFQVQSSQYCSECRDCIFCWGCRSCQECFGCANLRHARYCFFNEQLTADEYHRRISEPQLGSFSARSEMQKRVLSFWKMQPRPCVFDLNSEDISGNGIYNSTRVFDSFSIQGGEDIRFGYRLNSSVKNSYDFSFFGDNTECIYEAVHSGINSQNLLFCLLCWQNCCNLFYCINCVDCQDCFACVGLYKKRYCIFNKQYSKSEYHRLAAALVDSLTTQKIWGEFFPMEFSPQPYNHSTAFRHFPLTEEEAKARGLIWYEEPERNLPDIIDASALPDEIPEGFNSLLVRSAQSNRPYKITNEEIRVLRNFNAPLPRITYDERMLIRAAQMGDLRLHPALCAKSGETISAAYPAHEQWTLWDKELYRREFNG